MSSSDIVRAACMSYVENQGTVSFDDMLKFMAILEKRLGNIGILSPYSDLHSFIETGKNLGTITIDPVKGISLNKYNYDKAF